MAYETVIGLEVHAELSTKTKIFCGCSTAFGGEPNSHVCPVCLGMPGSLPVLNIEVVNKALLAGMALNCEIQKDNIFDRKNYFYPDLPKNYQISQLYAPIMRNGSVEIDMGDYKKTVRIHEIHMEEDAGKLVHDAGASLVDYNRCGVPLIEIVSEPDLSNADEVRVYIEKLREILVYLDVSDCRMEEGSMRADVNLSVKKEETDELGTRTETKNMNSIKAIMRAISFEEARQTALIEAGGRVVQETRRWDDAKGENYAMRNKENAQDYRYFPDPDLVPVHIDEERIAHARANMPELAEEKRSRYINEWNIGEKTARVLTAEKIIAEFFETLTAELGGGSEAAREAANVVTGDILRLMKEGETPEKKEYRLDAKKTAAVMKLTGEGKINRANARLVIEEIFRNDVDPLVYIEENDLLTQRDDTLLSSVIEEVLTENPRSVADYKAGKDKAFGYLVGQSMKALKGKADPKDVNLKLKELLESAGVSVDLGEKFRGEETEAVKSAERVSDNGYTPPLPSWKKHMPSEKQEADTGAIAASGRYRTKNCGEITESDVGSEVKLAGWIHAIRDHGGILFADLRDQYGVTQIVLRDEMVSKLKKESAVSVTGRVVKRDEDTINPNIATGTVELKAETIEVVGECFAVLPFEPEKSEDVKEELRLKYRYLDLRNPSVKDRILFRAEIIKYLRAEMEDLGFTEIQTPILANSSPEGARDYLVPSRKHKGMFYALPQAPQQFKQLLMASGFDRYYQIAPCFRDEDARLDRSPGEFYQLDFEMAFATQEDVFAVAEKVMSSTFKRFTDKFVTEPPYERIAYKDAMLRFGSDKPDLRNPLRIIDLSDFFADLDFAPFKGKCVRAIRVPGAISMSKSWFKNMEQFAFSVGMKGLGYISVRDDAGFKGPIDKFLPEDRKEELRALSNIEPGDVLYFIADEKKLAEGYAGKIRAELGERLGLIDRDRYEFCFITDYPMYEYNEEAGEIDFTHNPFSMPQGEMEALLTKDPEDILAWQYDIVCNGIELSSGAVRNHRPDIMLKAFEIAGYDEKTVEEKFGALYTAFAYGAPPHAGMAPGLDRIVMLLTGDENIREVIAFPLNSNAQNTMLGAPSEVTERQLREAHIKIR